MAVFRSLIGLCLPVVTAALALLAASPAAAAQRYASTDGALFAGSCPSESPCRIDRAINEAKSGDEVIVLPGHYNVTTTPLATLATLTVHGVDPASRPRLVSGSLADATLSLGNGSVISDLEVEQLGGGFGGEAALELSPDTTVERVIARSNTTVVIRGAAVQIRDTVAYAGGVVNTAIDLDGPGVSTIRNVTAIGVAILGAAGIAVRNSAATPAAVNVRNSIFIGEFQDITLGASETSSAELDIDYSNFRPDKAPLGSSNTTTYIPGTHNQDGNISPPLVAGAHLWEVDAHQLADSPTIDAGMTDPLTGPFDLDGEAREQGPAIDIGADELTFPQTIPQLTQFRQKRRVFAAGRRATPMAGQTSKLARRGTVFSYVLDQEAVVTMKIMRILPGHRAGRRCRRRRKGEKGNCTRLRKQGVLFRESHEGTNSIPFSGRLRNKPLPPGRYRAVVTAFNVLGKSASQTRAFRIVGR